MAEATNESLRANPTIGAWLRLPGDGLVEIRVGKVELGQGILTALCQIAADALCVDIETLTIVSGDTDSAPMEGYTAGSMSIETCGSALDAACSTLHGALIAAAAAKLRRDPAELHVTGGEVLLKGAGTGLTYWSMRRDLDLAAPVDPKASFGGARRWVGRSVPRIDLAGKIAGGRYIHDIVLDDMLHARVLRPPRRGARLAAFDAGTLTKRWPGISWICDGSLLMAVGTHEQTVREAIERARPHARWEGGRAIPDEAGSLDWLLSQPTADRTIETGEPIAIARPDRIVEATYSRPFLAHASLGPSCGLARFEGGILTVWTHSQGVFPLRNAIARALGLAPETVVVLHRHGAGCYGHNGADDAAFEAAFAAYNTPGRAVRVRWNREDEMTASPFGAAMATRISAELDDDGRPRNWTLHVWSPPHVSRPGANGGVNLLAAASMSNPIPPPPAADIPDFAGGGAVRNAQALYDLPGQTVHHHMIPDQPVRTSSFRTLGAFENIFAIECFMDELAEAAGRDPVAYRLELLSDPRARSVIETVAAMSGWHEAPATDATAKGIAFARYKNRSAYCAVVAEVAVEEHVGLSRIWCAVDAGLIVNPKGAASQIEGGIIQGASWALKEAVLFDGGVPVSADFAGYPIMRFSEVPEIAISLIDRPDERPLGIGEASSGQAAAAIGNAVARALGLRMRSLPMTRERILDLLAGA